MMRVRIGLPPPVRLPRCLKHIRAAIVARRAHADPAPPLALLWPTSRGAQLGVGCVRRVVRASRERGEPAAAGVAPRTSRKFAWGELLGVLGSGLSLPH